MRGRHGHHVRAAACAVAMVFAVAASASCGGGDDTTVATTAATTQPRDFSERGPHAVGVTRLALGADRPVEVFYPAIRSAVPAGATPYRYTPVEVWGDLLRILPAGVVETVRVPGAWLDVPSSTGAFPLVVLSHGVGMKRFSYTLHAAHLASWGYVVACPEHPGRNLQARLGGGAVDASDEATILDTVALLRAESDRAGGRLEGRVDAGRVAAEGHSAGGRDAALAAYDPKVDTWIGVAPSAPVPDAAAGDRDVIADGELGFDPAKGEFDLSAFLAQAAPPEKPSMMVVASHDVVFPLDERRALFDWLAPPKRFVVLADTGHYAFVNECAATQALDESAIAKALGFPSSSVERRLLEDGCLKKDAPVEQVWAVWGHLVVAQLNWVFGIEREVAAASLDQRYLDRAFPGRISRYLVAS